MTVVRLGARTPKASTAVRGDFGFYSSTPVGASTTVGA